MATKTLYYTTTNLGTDCNQKQETNPSGSLDTTTSVKSGKGAAGSYWLFVPGLTDSATNNTTFRTTRGTAAAGYRSQNAYSGTFASGNWTVYYKVQNRAAYTHAGRLVANIYRSTYANPTPAQLTLMNSAEGQSAIITFAASTPDQHTGSWTVNVNQNLTLTNEYLFIIVNWLVTTAGGNVNAGIKWGVQDGAEYEVTADFTAQAVIQLAPNTEGLTDTPVRREFSIRLSTNTEGLTEAILAWDTTIELLGIAEAIVYKLGGAVIQFANNTLGITEAIVRRLWSLRLSSDTLGITEAIAKRFFYSTAEALGFTEAIAKLHSYFSADIEGLTEAVINRLRSIRFSPNTEGLTDGIARLMRSVRLTPDTEGLTEVSSRRNKGTYFPTDTEILFDNKMKFENYATGADGYHDVWGDNWYAQSFTPITAHRITSVKLLLSRLNSPGTVTVSIKATDGSGHPTGDDLCSGTLNGNLLPNVTPEWKEVSLGDGANLSTVKYAIVVRALSGNSSNYVDWSIDGTGPTYAGGCVEESANAGASWSSWTNQDFMFEEWGNLPFVSFRSYRFGPDTESLVEGMVRRLWSIRPIADTVLLVDSLVRRLWSIYLVPNILGITEGVVRVFGIAGAIVEFANNTVGITEALVRRMWETYLSTNTEGITEAVSKLWLKTSANTLGITESIGKAFFHLAGDTLGITEVLIRRLRSIRLSPDAEGIVEAVIRKARAVYYSANTEGLTESIIRRGRAIYLSANTEAITEAISKMWFKFSANTEGITEAIVRRLWSIRFVPDTEGITEAVVRRMRTVKQVLDNLGLTEVILVVEAAAAILKFAADTLGIIETLSRVKKIVKQANDYIGVAVKKIIFRV